MTEVQWLTCTDLAAMLAILCGQDASWTAPYAGGFMPPGWRPGKCLASNRQLRLFVCAVCRLVGLVDAKPVAVCEAWADGGTAPARNTRWVCADPDAVHAASVAAEPRFGCHFGPDHRPSVQPAKAAILRDIIGNPWRPVTLPHVADCVVCGGSGSFLLGSGEDAERMDCPCCPWRTPTVLSLARAAYEERPGRKCETCSDEYYNTPGALRDAPCPQCHGAGRIDDGTLDPVRLAILADALEEAGCEEETILRHLRGEERQLNGDHPICWGALRGPHVKGCFALDCILGRLE